MAIFPRFDGRRKAEVEELEDGAGEREASENEHDVKNISLFVGTRDKTGRL